MTDWSQSCKELYVECSTCPNFLINYFRTTFTSNEISIKLVTLVAKSGPTELVPDNVIDYRYLQMAKKNSSFDIRGSVVSVKLLFRYETSPTSFVCCLG